MQIRNHVFLITGGASGLGAATARLLVSEGGSVVLADTNRTTGEALAAELGPSARFSLTDVTSEPDAQAAVDLALSAFGHLHSLINCAGIAPSEKVIGRGAQNLKKMKVLHREGGINGSKDQKALRLKPYGRCSGG